MTTTKKGVTVLLPSARPRALLFARLLKLTVSQKDEGYGRHSNRSHPCHSLFTAAAVEGDDTPAADQGTARAVDEGAEGSVSTEQTDRGEDSLEPASAVEGELSVPEDRVGGDSGPEEEESGGITEDLTQSDAPEDAAKEESGDGDGSAPDVIPDSDVITGVSSNSAVDQVLDAEYETAQPVALDATNAANANDDQESELPPHPVCRNSNRDEAVVPPPAPTRAAVVMSGSMNPEVDDDSDESDSDEEDDGIHGSDDSLLASPPAPVVSTHDSTDDDDDELEVDPAVSSTIQPISRAAKKVTAEITANMPLKPGISDLDTKAEDVSVGFGDEIRVASVVVESELDSSTTTSSKEKEAGNFSGVDEKVMKAKQLQRAKKDDDVAFGIAYQSSKKRLSQTPADEVDEYTLSKGPAFPDEKEFEGEVQIDSDASFLAKNDRRWPRSKQENADDSAGNADDSDDDEFSFDETSAAEASPAEVATFTEEELEARRASMAARKAQQEAEMLEELKRATDDERKMIERAEAAEHQHETSAGSSETGTTLSLGELHSMYKRGLGDQSVHFLDETGEGTGKNGAGAAAGAPAPTTEGVKAVNPPPERLSVMGRLLSKPHALTDVIIEAENEDEGDDQDGDGGLGNGGHDHDEMSAGDAARFGVRTDQQTLLNYNDDDYNDDDDVGGDEWKEIQLTEKVASISGNNADGTADDAATSTSSPLKPPQQQWRISYTESAGYFAEAPEFLDQRDRIVPEEFPARTSCFSCLSRLRLTFPGAIDERDRVFCIAATAFEPSNDVFCRMLQTIYARLVPSTSAPSLIGGHWEQIGFQGSDPAMDLRGVGVLALLQMLYLVESHGELARRLHSLSQHSTRHFPFACALINTTLQCLVALRSGALYPECNKHASVVAGINMVRVFSLSIGSGDSCDSPLTT